jgi:hypothetical protein
VDFHRQMQTAAAVVADAMKHDKVDVAVAEQEKAM